MSPDPTAPEPDRPDAPTPGAPTPDAPTPDAPTPGAGQPSAWRRLGRTSAPRRTKAQLLGAVLALALGFAIATQVQQTQVGGLETMRQDDLFRVLGDVNQRSSRLDQQVRELQSQRDQLANGAGSSQAAIQQAQRRLDALRLLAGTAPAQGQGIRLTITDPEAKVTAPMLLDAAPQ